MTKEENKAIEDCKEFIEYLKNSGGLYYRGVSIKKITEALLNLIEKLQKEIEDWKDVCHSLTDEEELENKIKLFKPSIKALNKLEDGKKEAQFMSKLIKYYKVILKEKKQIYEELKRRNENNG